jgi:proteasome beta subunit
MGYFVAHKKGKKIYQIDDHLAMTISGSVADAQRIVEILKVNARLYKLNFGRPIPVNSAGRLVSNLLFSARLAPLIAQILVGGVDDTGPHVFSLDPFGSLTEDPVAYGVLEDKYKEGSKISDMLSVVVRAVDSAMKRDTASGDSFDMATITEDGYCQLGEEEKKNILRSS